MAILRHEAAPFVARQGWPILTIPQATTERPDEVAATVAAFKAVYREAGHGDPDGLPLGFALRAFVADDRAAAAAREAMERYVRTRRYARQRPYEELVARDLIAFGSPDDVVAVLRRYEAVGFRLLLALVNVGGLEAKTVLDAMERLAREVMPAFA